VEESSEVRALARQLRSQIAALALSDTASLRGVRREFSRLVKDAEPAVVMALAMFLLLEGGGVPRFVTYEIVCHHKRAFANLGEDDLPRLGRGIDSWSAVDCFAMYLSGPIWMHGRVSDETIYSWARSEDRWWRRTALVSTVALSRRGDPGDVRRVERTCGMLVEDRDDMVVKALSWALRELSKKHPDEARRFLAEHRAKLAARAVREVENKLRTGLKNPRRAS
jgi:hypothetical protein